MKLGGKSFNRGLVTRATLTGVACVTILLFMAHRINRPRQHDAASLIGTATSASGDERVSQLLTPIRQKHGVPAIAAALVNSRGIVVVGAVGGRKRGSDIAVTKNDLWHLGSDTKAMTATLVARLVEQGKLKWETTVAEIFPEDAAQFHPDMKGLTMLHLLSHRAGLPANVIWRQFGSDDVRQERLKVVRAELAKSPKHNPGSTYEYSNLGYVVAGAMIEKITRKTWEQAMQDEIFTPLVMKSAGFGGTGKVGEINQPWPHKSDGQPVAMNGPATDNPPVMGPAGRVHCTTQDWAKFIQDQLRGARGEPALLKPESYEKLHTPPFGGDYALGWVTAERGWGGGKVLNHGGDNTMNCANVWIAPQRDFAVLVCINQGGDTAFKAADKAVGALIKLHDEKPPAK